MPDSNSSSSANDGSEIEPSVAASSRFDDLEPPGSSGVREGLPPSYRMRADRHYIDHLESSVSSGLEWLDPAAIEVASPADDASIGPLVESIRKHGLLQPLLIQHRDGAYRLIAGKKRQRAAMLAGLRRVPCMVREVDDESARALGEAANISATPTGASASPAAVDTSADVARSLETLWFCASLVSDAASHLAREISTDLIAAEAWRALSVVGATRVLHDTTSATRRVVSPRSVIGRIERGFLSECRLRNVVMEIDDQLPKGLLVRADERLLVIALSAAINATLALLGREHAPLRLAAAADQPGSVSFAVTQSAVVAPDCWASRAFDTEWTDRPGGPSAVASMLALRRIADASSGSVSVGSTRRGTSVTLTIPSA